MLYIFVVVLLFALNDDHYGLFKNKFSKKKKK